MPSFLTSSWGEVKDWFGGTTDTTGMTTEQASSATSAKRMANAGLILSVLGGINQAIGGFYAAKSAQYQANSQALNYGFESDLAAINARTAEYDAQSILDAGQNQTAAYTMEAGQRKAAAKTSMAARGVVMGEGAARDVEASMDIVKDIDVLTINSNAVRAAEAQRTQGTNYRNQALMYDVSAQNARRTARSISPGMALGASLLNSASSIAAQWIPKR